MSDTSKYNNFEAPKVPATIIPSEFQDFKRKFINACYMEGPEIMAHLLDDADIPPPANIPNPYAANPNSHDYRVHENTMAELYRDYKAFISRKKKLITIIHQRLPSSISLRLDADPEFHRIKATDSVHHMLNLVERLCYGNTGATVYKALAYLTRIECEQDKLTEYNAKFNDLLREIEITSTTDADRWAKLKNAVYLMGLIKVDMFRDYLENQVLTQPEWPPYHALYNTLLHYQDNKKHIKETLHGKISANATYEDNPADDFEFNQVYLKPVCYNCGGDDHISNKCPESFVSICRVPNCNGKHQTRFHDRVIKFNEERSSKKAAAADDQGKFQRSPTKQFSPQSHSKRSPIPSSDGKLKTPIKIKRNFTRKQLVNFADMVSNEVMAANTHYLHELIQETTHDDDQIEVDMVELDLCVITSMYNTAAQSTMVSEPLPQSYQPPDDLFSLLHAASSYHVEVTEVNDGGNGLLEEHHDYQIEVVEIDVPCFAMDLSEDKYIIDSGCKGAHVLKSDKLVSSLQDASGIRVNGFAGPSHVPQAVGTLLNTTQRTLVVPAARTNLLSLSLMLNDKYSFQGDREGMTILDSKGSSILHAKNLGDGYYVCSERDLIHAYSNQTQPTFANDVFLTPPEKIRAGQCRELHKSLGHPGDSALAKALDGGSYPEMRLTSKDVRNAHKLFGPCTSCLIGKSKCPQEPPSISPPAARIGDRVHVDIYILNQTSLGGNNFILLATDERSDFLVGEPVKTKSSKDLCVAFDKIISTFNGYGHAVRNITTDDEATLHACRTHLQTKMTTLNHTPAGHHEKKIERTIQTIKYRLAALKASLPYVLPSFLEAEAVLHVIKMYNIIPTTTTGRFTPYQLVTGSKPDVPMYPFGTVGHFYYRRSDDTEIKAELGIFLGHGDYNWNNNSYLRAFFPKRHGTYSVRRFTPNVIQSNPPEWNFQQNPRPTISSGNPSEAPETDTPTMLQPSHQLNHDVQTNTNVLPPPTAPVDSIAQPTLDPAPLPPASNQEGALPTIDRSPPTPPLISQPTLNQEGAQRISPPTVIPTSPPSDARQEGDSLRFMPIIQRSSPTSPTVSTPAATLEAPPPSPSMMEPTRNTKEPKPSSLPPTRTLPSRSAKTAVLDKGLKEVDRRTKPTTAGNTEVILDTILDVWVHRSSLQQALKNPSRRDAILQAINAEIDTVIDPKVMSPVKHNAISPSLRGNILQLWLFAKEKFKADGSFDKDKARIVPLSQHRDTSSIGNTYSPTVNPLSVMLLLQLAAKLHTCPLTSYDVKGAFLMTPIPTSKQLHVKVNGDLLEFMVKRNPKLTSFIHEDGFLYFLLHRYLYGLHESPQAFNEMLNKDLRELGYLPTKSDRCLYVKFTSHGMNVLTVHVDDILLLSASTQDRDHFEKFLQRKYTLTIQRNNLSYLGLTIKRSSFGISINQAGYIDSMLAKFSADKLKINPSCPSTESILKKEASQPIHQSKYLSLTMSLMYLGRFTRPDILFSVVFLATYSANPTQRDYHHLLRILAYVEHTKHLSVHYSSSASMIPTIYADASHHLHHDSKGHGGIIITLGSGPIAYRSFKLKLVTRSSTESELVALEEAATYASFLSQLLSDLHISVSAPITIYQDNQSTIAISKNGGSFSRTKHFLNRQQFVTQLVKDNVIKPTYLPSTVMPADLLTKPLAASTIKNLLQRLNIK